jgi:hypothetical protein
VLPERSRVGDEAADDAGGAMKLHEHVPGVIWVASYPIRLAMAAFDARTSIIRASDGGLVVHSPGPLDRAARDEILALGRARVIVAPGNFHHLYVADCQRAFPDAATWICPGVEHKQPQLRYDGILDDEAPALLGEFDQVVVRGGRYMCEVAMLHRPSRTLLLVDLLENFTDPTTGTSWIVRASFKALGMWNAPAPAPEYRFGWKDRRAARRSLERILAWDFDRIVISHGELIDEHAKGVARRAWQPILGAS